MILMMIPSQMFIEDYFKLDTDAEDYPSAITADNTSSSVE